MKDAKSRFDLSTDVDAEKVKKLRRERARKRFSSSSSESYGEEESEEPPLPKFPRMAITPKRNSPVGKSPVGKSPVVMITPDARLSSSNGKLCLNILVKYNLG